ncbi:MAG: AraC family transcriptional regulator [Lewinella sp.]
MKQPTYQRPISFKIPKPPRDGLRVQVDEGPAFYPRLHFHPEFQITAIIRGQGQFYAGNSLTDFAAGDVFFIGADVPHLLKCTGIFATDQSPGVKGISLFFDRQTFGPRFFDLREMQRLDSFLKNARRVIKIFGSSKSVLHQKIVSSTGLAAEELIINLLQVLSAANKAGQYYLNSEQYQPIATETESSRMNEVLEFTFNNFQQDITIDTIAGVACLSRSQFSSFFKLHTGKTYIRFLNDLRIENACTRLKNSEVTIEQICYEVGFKNVSNFTRQFRQLKETTPSGYRKNWRV